MKQKKWLEIEQIIYRGLEDELKLDARPVAAFDADGTLWNTDLGENFFKYQITQNLLPRLPENPWKYYRDWKESGDPRHAYLWLAQINQGHRINEVRDWAEAAVRQISPLPIFAEQQNLIQYFLSRGVQVYIVTASVSWAVEPGAQRLGIARDNVLGVCTRIEKDIVTPDQEGLITYREGKLQALLKATNGKSPFFASGNTTGDLNLLQGAKLRLCVGAAKAGDELFQTEESLRQTALKENWLIYQF